MHKWKEQYSLLPAKKAFYNLYKVQNFGFLDIAFDCPKNKKFWQKYRGNIDNSKCSRETMEI